MPLQKLLMTQGINTDFSPELVRQGEARYRINCRVLSSQNGEEESLETMNGNTLVAYSLPAGNNTVIGAKEYLIGSKIYYFIYNDQNNHAILEYDEVANSVTPVLISTLLNFQLTNLITGINVIRLTDTAHLLYWTDNYNEPRKINIEKGKYFMAGNYTLGYPTPFVEEFIYRIKKPMPLSPTTVYANDATQVVNKLDKRLFQFKVQNVFDDFETSSWSPITKTVFPVISGTYYYVVGANNLINVTVDTGSSIVKKIRIAVKESTEIDFKLVIELDKASLGIADNSTYVYSFYNNINYLPLEVNESIKLFDNVPKKSKAQELIYGNRIIDGLITEGFDAVTADLKIDYTLAASKPSPSQLIINSLKRGGNYNYGIIYYDHANRSGATNVNKGQSNVVQANGNYGTNLFVPFYTNAVQGFLVVNYTTISGAGLVVGHAVTTNLGTQAGVIVAFTGDTITIGSLTGDWSNIGFVITNIIQTVNFTTTDVYFNIGNLPVGGYVPSESWGIYNEPPSWATHYQIARVKNSSNDRYLQWAATGILFLNSSNVSVGWGDLSAVKMQIDLSSITGSFLTANPGSILVYDFIKGDRIRFISKTPDYTTFLNSYIDLEVSSFDSSTSIMEVALNPEVYPYYFTPIAGSDIVLFEIYYPQLPYTTENSLTYEIACGNTINYDSARGHYVHNGDVNSQIITNFTSATYASPPTFNAVLPTGHGLVTNDKVKILTSGYSVYGVVASSTANAAVITTNTTLVGTFNGALAGTISKGAQGVFSGGDTFYRTRVIPVQTNLIEDANYSDLYVSQGYDYGRPNRIDPNYREIVRPSTLYYSEQFVPETFINGLSTVYDTSFQTYEDKYGGIYKLYALNQRLIAFQELKIGAILVQQIVYNNATGGSVVGISTDVLSPQMVYDVAEVGIGKYPESFAVYGNSIYGIDVLRGVIWRRANDGIDAISDQGNISTFIRQQCNTILQSTNKVNIYGVFDVRFGEYVVAFSQFYTGSPGHSVLNQPITLAWNEERNAWSSQYSYFPEMMVSKGIDIVTFKNGGLWLHNTNPIQGNFYGVQYYAEAWLVANLLPSNKKVAKAVSLESDAAWNVTIDSPEGQTTSLIPNNFQMKEGFYYSEILRDDNTPNVLNPRFEGNPMRSCTFLVKIKYQNTIYNKIFAVNVLMIQSQRSNK